MATEQKQAWYHWSWADTAPPHLRPRFTHEQLWALAQTARVYGWEWTEANVEKTFMSSPGFRRYWNREQWFVLKSVASTHGWAHTERYCTSILAEAETVLGPLAPENTWTRKQLRILTPVALDRGWHWTEKHAQDLLSEARRRGLL